MFVHGYQYSTSTVWNAMEISFTDQLVVSTLLSQHGIISPHTLVHQRCSAGLESATVCVLTYICRGVGIVGTE